MAVVLGVTGWSGAGKTTLIEAVLPRLTGAGLIISTVKHTHHRAEWDAPGKDSWRHREAGAREVMLAAPGRWALQRQEPGTDWALEALLSRMAPADLILVEGYREDPVPKLEIYRPTLGKAPLWPASPSVLAVASDVALPDCDRPVLPLNDISAITSWMMSFLPGHRFGP